MSHGPETACPVVDVLKEVAMELLQMSEIVLAGKNCSGEFDVPDAHNPSLDFAKPVLIHQSELVLQACGAGDHMGVGFAH